MVAILGYSRKQISAAVQDMYTAVAADPNAGFHFPVGEEVSRMLDYPAEQFAQLPRLVRDSFIGVGCPLRAGAPAAGETVLDIGAGAGTDTLLAAQTAGRVLALDLTSAMTERLQQAVVTTGVSNVHIVQASAESLPLANESVDLVISNGMLNLVPDKRRAVAEMFRVLRPGGRVQIADVVIQRPVTVDCSSDPRLWAECVVGATVEEELLALFVEAGFEDVRVVRRHDYFAHSPSEQTREIAAGFGARSIELTMRRREQAPGRVRQWWQRYNPVRLLAQIRRHGLVGVASLALAILACYGTLVALALLATVGAGITLSDVPWAGPTSALVAIFTAAVVAVGVRRHRRIEPVVLAVVGAGMVAHALLVEFDETVELIGFIVLAIGVGLDIWWRRRMDAHLLGLQKDE